jgi:hypothetical protein
MPFKKGHIPNPEWAKKAGRPKGSKSYNSLDKFPVTKEWVKKTSKKCENIDDIDYYLYNNIPLEEYYKKINNEDM